MANGWGGEGLALVVGGLMRGCAVAARLAECGGEVIIVEPGGELAADLGPRARWPIVERLRALGNLRVLLGATLERVGEDGALVRRKKGEELRLEGVGLLVPALKLMPQDGLSVSLAEALPDLPVHLVGDCREPRDAFAAVQEGAALGRRL
ncbi:MAG: NAD-binding protein, partial [Candidatus Bipolaricaulia bacterium]